MTPFEIDETLKSFSVIYDTREHETGQARKRYESMGVPVERDKLEYCDYACNVMFPDGSRLHQPEEPINPPCAIERKQSLDELAMCFTRGRDRFRREFERARAAGAKVYLLVEEGSYEAIIRHRYRSKYNPAAFMASLIAWSVRYDMTPVFCKAETSGELIKEILYRDMKERLTRGEYDERGDQTQPADG